MKKSIWLVCCLFSLATAFSSMAADLPQRVVGHQSVLHGGNAEFNKSGADTIVLIGPWDSGAQANGQFQDESGNPAWNLWTHRDATQPSTLHWHVSSYAASNLPGGLGNLAAFCGDENFPSCDEMDPMGGYGNNWQDILDFHYVVADAAAGCSMQISGVFNSDTEPGYDFIEFSFLTAEGPVVAEVFDGIHQAQAFNYSFNYEPADYAGINNDEIHFQIFVSSDGGYSDEDCSYWGNGACQVDDLNVQCSNGGYDGFTDFQDGTLGDWNSGASLGSGDFTDLWVGLGDIDPCHNNYSPQVAFIDDGTKVPGVGPSFCQNWCYGPGGYIVNTTGGALQYGHIYNVLVSPVVAWPGSEFIGGELDFGVYRHEDLTADSPGIFYLWEIRSTADEATSPIASQPWRDRNFVYYGGPEYVRPEIEITDLLEPNPTHVQVQLTCFEIPTWTWTGNDGYPAPYFDNVRLKAFAAYGPAMSTSELNLAQDNFTATGEEVDLANLASNYVRFDGARNKAAENEEHNIPGDSITCDVAVVRTGGVLVSNRLVYTMQRNPVFDSVRNPLWGVSGFTDGIQQGSTNSYYYDLPDSGFLFPGDVLHYYFEATDEVDHTDPETVTLPEDISGFGNFSNPIAYDTSFQVHALPSVNADAVQPSVLFWNDFADGGGESEWYTAFNNLGWERGVDYDVYFTNGPSSGIGNGLGGRAVYDQVKYYTDLLYTSGDLSVNTISNGDYNHDPGRDVQLLQEWFSNGGGRDAFLCGDNLVRDLAQSGQATSSFVSDLMNVQFESYDIRPFIHGQTTPLVLPETENSVFNVVTGWIAYGGCLGMNTFDAVISGEGAERLARFGNLSGQPNYHFSAATLNEFGNDRVITMPYDFMSIYSDPDHLIYDGLSARVYLLKEILTFFQVEHSVVSPSHSLAVERFSTSNAPNPFNPATKIRFHLPKAGHLSLKVYNLRGQLVKTLIDELYEAGDGHIFWDGTNEQGANVSSGIYFYEARRGGDVKVSKMALVK